MGLIQYFNFFIFLLFALIWLSVSLFLRLKRKESFIYLIFFSIFSIYLYKVLDYTLFQFQSLLFLKIFAPNLMLRGVEAGKSLNIVPLITLTPKDITTSLLNILLFIPFGFGLPFITHFKMKKVIVIGALVSIMIELLQLLTGNIAQTTFRIADINDVLFNSLGVVIGYILFIGLLSLARHLTKNRNKAVSPFLRFLSNRPL